MAFLYCKSHFTYPKNTSVCSRKMAFLTHFNKNQLSKNNNIKIIKTILFVLI